MVKDDLIYRNHRDGKIEKFSERESTFKAGRQIHEGLYFDGPVDNK